MGCVAIICSTLIAQRQHIVSRNSNRGKCNSVAKVPTQPQRKVFRPLLAESAPGHTPPTGSPD